MCTFNKNYSMYLRVYAIILIQAVTSYGATAGMSNGAGYSMYVWTTGFDKNVTGTVSFSPKFPNR